MSRILLFGGTGQLGLEFMAMAPASGHTFFAPNRQLCDITDQRSVRAVMQEYRPDWVINCAAWTRVDDAEANPEAAFAINAFGARVVASGAREVGAAVCQVSTDFVFDGSLGRPLTEWDSTNPLSVYGKSKLAGEHEVLGIAERALIVRTAWLFGMQGPNFIRTILKKALPEGGDGVPGGQPAQAAQLCVVADQYGSPTWTRHLAPVILTLLARGVWGTYHVVNSGTASWHDVAVRAVRAAGINAEVKAVGTGDYPVRAQRPQFSVLDTAALRLLGEHELLRWEDAVDSYVAQVMAARATATGGGGGIPAGMPGNGGSGAGAVVAKSGGEQGGS